MFMSKKGFTLVEIMIVVAIIGILVAIAVPGFIKAREKAQERACWEAQEKLEGAEDQWALDEGKSTGDEPGWADLVGIQSYLKRTPLCPLDSDDDGSPDPLEIVPLGQVVPCVNGVHSTRPGLPGGGGS